MFSAGDSLFSLGSGPDRAHGIPVVVPVAWPERVDRPGGGQRTRCELTLERLSARKDISPRLGGQLELSEVWPDPVVRSTCCESWWM